MSTKRDVRIAQRRRGVTEMYLQGYTQAEIAVKWNVTQQQISNDLITLQAAWRDDAKRSIDDIQSRELARIDQLERTYREAWERSCQDRTIKSAKEKDSTRETSKEKAARSEPRDGDPRFLEGIRWCIEQRLKIFGLYAAQKFDVGWREHAERSGVNAGAAFEAMVQFYASAVAGADGSGSASGGAAQTADSASSSDNAADRTVDQ